MKSVQVEFLKSAPGLKFFPDLPHPEFAFVGRSNVGKSSLLNMIAGQKNLCRTGARPGVTQTVNFFIMNRNTTLVDLPGYGYARVSKTLKKQFQPLVSIYLQNRGALRLVFLLVDIRRVPGDYEKSIITECGERNVPVAIIATKCDKLSNNALAKQSREISQALDIDAGSIFFTSSKSGMGKREILGLMEEYSHPNAGQR
jgi:GTP-binding protein